MRNKYVDFEIADRIQEVFYKYDLHDEQVGNAIGYERKSVLSWRKGIGNPSNKLIRYLCSNYDVSPEWLLNIEGKK